ncbi:MAG: 6-bladed beta-propeller [Longimicrobiales bacterium]
MRARFRPVPLLLAAACGGGGAATAEGDWRATRNTIGDTIVVTTVSGSTWQRPRALVPEVRIGELEGADEYLFGQVQSLAVDAAGRIYVFDWQVPALRVYDADGRFVRTIGREGGGPGEYKQPDAGLIVLPDGRTLLRDPGNGRINVYGPDGTPLDSWPVRASHYSSRPFYSDTAGNVYSYVFGLDRGDGRDAALIRYSPQGDVLDTLDLPQRDYEAPTITAAVEGARQTWLVPFSPRAAWTYSPHGYFVQGVGTSYAVDLLRGEAGVLRIGRRTEPVPVAASERAYEEDRVSRAMRRLDPAWSWNGPPIPETKPPFRDIAVATDGRIWVQLHQPGHEVADAAPEDGGTRAGEPPAPARWAEPVVYDVFRPDGTYLGEVHAPDGFQTSPTPLFGADRVWAVIEDELGVNYVVRLRLETATG